MPFKESCQLDQNRAKRKHERGPSERGACWPHYLFPTLKTKPFRLRASILLTSELLLVAHRIRSACHLCPSLHKSWWRLHQLAIFLEAGDTELVLATLRVEPCVASCRTRLWPAAFTETKAQGSDSLHVGVGGMVTRSLASNCCSSDVLFVLPSPCLPGHL